MMNLKEWVKQAVVPLVVSAAIGGYNILHDANVQKTLLQQNLVVTADLTKAVNDLRLQMAVFSEKYVTRDELERKLGVLNGPRISNLSQPVGADQPAWYGHEVPRG